MTTPVQPQATVATQHQIRSAELLSELWNSADMGSAIRKKAKEKFPDIRLPEETIEPVIHPLKEENEELRKRLDDLAAKFEAREKETESIRSFTALEDAVNKAVRKYNLTEEGRVAMLDRMKETKNWTAIEDAAAFIAHSTPPQTSEGPTWALPTSKANLFGSAERDERFARLHTNPDGYLDDELRAFAKDPDKYVQETFGRAA